MIRINETEFSGNRNRPGSLPFLSGKRAGRLDACDPVRLNAFCTDPNRLKQRLLTMPNNPNFPHFDYFEVEFTKDGEIAQRQQVDDLIHFLHATGTTTDLFVISHGWNNDMNDARQLYVNFFGILKTQLGTSKFANLNPRKFTVLGVLLPSKKFPDQDLIPGNATGDAGGASDVASTADVAQDDLLQRLDLF